MALTAFPVVQFSPGSGSDTAASGAGPATAVTGTTNAVTNSTTVTFAGAPDLSGVAQDGSHVLWVNGVGFVRISTVDNTAKSVVVETAITCSSGTAFAVGGKRALWNSTESARLFAATSSPTAVGASGGWTITTDGTQTSATTLAIAAPAPITQPPLVIRGESGLVEVNCSGSGVTVITVGVSGSYVFQNIQIRHTHPTVRGQGLNVSGGTAFVEFRDCVIGAADGTNCPTIGANRGGGTGYLFLHNTSILRCSSHGVSGWQYAYMVASEVSRCGASGVNASWGFAAIGCIFSHNTTYGVITNILQGGDKINVAHCTFHGNGSDGLALTSSANQIQFHRLVNNQYTANGGYGLNIVPSGPNYGFIEGNNFGNASDATANTSGAVNGVTLSASNSTVAPRYVDPSAGVRNFAVSGAGQGSGYPKPPLTIAASSTLTYLDVGASQHGPNKFVIGG